jgi:hypothetical protein
MRSDFLLTGFYSLCQLVRQSTVTHFLSLSMESESLCFIVQSERGLVTHSLAAFFDVQQNISAGKVLLVFKIGHQDLDAILQVKNIISEQTLLTPTEN